MEILFGAAFATAVWLLCEAIGRYAKTDEAVARTLVSKPMPWPRLNPPDSIRVREPRAPRLPSLHGHASPDLGEPD